MESLLANYASEEEEEDNEKEEKKDSFPSSKPTPKPLSLSPPKQHSPSSGSSSIFSSLPRPKSSPSSIFSSIPPPKSHPSKTPIPSSSDPTPKRVVQFRPPLHPFHLKSQHSDIDDDDDDKDQAKPTKKIPFSIQNAPSKSFSSALPAPKNSLCLAPSRKSTVEATTAHKAAGDVSRAGLNTGAYENLGNYESSSASAAQGMGNAGGGNYVNYGSYQGNSGDWPLVEGSGNDENYQNLEAGSIDGLSGMGSENYGNYANYMSHEGNAVDGSLLASGENYVNYGSYEGNWVDGSTAVMSSGPSATTEGIGRITGKRGRNEIPADFVEVKQDELISNRPREDQVKLTGIAFGPAYQPVSSAKGKPTKLHKRKHQIGSLYFDMKQKEMELAERRSKGFLTKAETQAKYGW